MQIIGIPQKNYQKHTAHIHMHVSKQTKYEEIEVLGKLQSLDQF